MTDSRLRGEWLGTMRFDDLSDIAWRVFTSALMWSNQNGTDGRVPRRYLRSLHPDGEQPDANVELVKAGFWTAVPEGYLLLDWDGALGQATAEYVQGRRRLAADRQRAKREREKKVLTDKADQADARRADGASVTRDVRGDVRAHVGEGEGAGEGLGQGGLPTPLSEPPTRVIDWPVVEIPSERATA